MSLDGKRTDFVRRAAMHSSQKAGDDPAKDTRKFLLRKRVSYPLSSKANQMGSTLPVKRVLQRRSVGGLSSSMNAVEFSIKANTEKCVLGALKLQTDTVKIVATENSLKENAEPNFADPDEPNRALDTKGSKQSSDDSTKGGTQPDIQGEVAELDSVLNSASVDVQTERTTTPSGSACATPVSSVSDPKNSIVVTSANVTVAEPIADLPVAKPSPESNNQECFEGEAASLPAQSSLSPSNAGNPSPNDASPPSSMTSSANSGSDELHRIVEMFRQSGSIPKRRSRPSSNPQSPSTISSERVYSPVDEYRIHGRLAEDEWKRRARVAEEALAKIRRELHHAESTYEEVLKKCAEETKEAVTRLNNSVQEGQIKVMEANMEVRLLQAELERSQNEAKRMESMARRIVVLLILVIGFIVYDSLSKSQSLYFS